MPVRGLHRARMHVCGEFQRRFECVVDFLLQCGVRGQFGVPPLRLVDHHAVLVGVGDASRLQLTHVLERALDLASHAREESVVMAHAADVDGKTEARITDERLLKAIPVAHMITKMCRLMV